MGAMSLFSMKSDGARIWKTRIGEAGGHKRYPGPRGTPTVDGGEIFVLNQYADLACLDAERWHHEIGRSILLTNTAER